MLERKDLFRFWAIVGRDGGAYPVVGMPIEHPVTMADYIVTKVEPAPDMPFRISTDWASGESLPLYTGQVSVICRPALEGEIKEWADKQVAEHGEWVRHYESLRKPLWKRLLGFG